ncbi:MAG: glycosyltransferase [Candidatus Micrarchaeales archaeon]|nr:glycosyltransferase [Candidatus Micrarchaeales archaeon]
MEKIGKLKIVFYTDSFLPAHDGVVSSILNFRKELMRRGHEVHIFTAGNSKTKEAVAGMENIHVIKGIKFPKYKQYNVALAPFITQMKLNEINPDIIHCHTPFFMGAWGLTLGKVNKIPVVSTFHTLFTDRFVLQEYFSKRAVPYVQKYSWTYARLFYNRCDRVMAPSETLREVLEKHGISKVSTVPNGVDTDRFNPSIKAGSLRRRLRKDRYERIVLYLGRMSKEKRVETLLKAAKLLKDDDVRFIMAGAGPSLDKYKHIADRMRLDNVEFTGFVSDKALPKYYAACDAFCIPSTFETQGVVCLEAMACGKPVVGADKLALAEIIKNGRNGEKFKSLDSRECARKIKKALNNASSYKETRKTAMKYSIERTTDELLNVYNKVITEVTV